MNGPTPSRFRAAIVSSTPYAPPWTEGVRNIVRRFAHGLRAAGIGTTVIAPASPRTSSRGESGEDVIPVDAPSAPGGPLRVWSQLSLWRRTVQAAGSAAAQADVVLLLASLRSGLGLRTAALKRRVRKPLLVYVTGLGRPTLGYRWGLRADRVLVGSEFLLHWFPGAGVLHPVLPLHFTPCAERPRRPATERFSFLFLGSLEPQRGVECLLRATAMARARGDRAIRLTIAWNGHGAANERRIVRMIESLRIGDTVAMVGHADTAALYAQADAVVIPRVARERMAFPVRILEAVSAHRPLIVSRICGMEALVPDCSVAAEPGDPRSLADAMRSLAGDPALYDRLQAHCAGAAARLDSAATIRSLIAEMEGVRPHEP